MSGKDKRNSTEYALMRESNPPILTFPYTEEPSPQGATSPECQILLPAQLWFTHKDTSCTSTSIIPSALGNISLQKWGGLRWPSVTWVTGAKRVSKCDKSCWALSSQVPFVHSHLHTKEALSHKRRCSGGGYGWFNNNMVVFCLEELKEIYLIFFLVGKMFTLPINTRYNVGMLRGLQVMPLLAILI